MKHLAFPGIPLALIWLQSSAPDSPLARHAANAAAALFITGGLLLLAYSLLRSISRF